MLSHFPPNYFLLPGQKEKLLEKSSAVPAAFGRLEVACCKSQEAERHEAKVADHHLKTIDRSSFQMNSSRFRPPIRFRVATRRDEDKTAENSVGGISQGKEKRQK